MSETSTEKKATKKKSAKKAKTAKKASGSKKKITKKAIKKSFWFHLTEDEKKVHADETIRLLTEKGKKELQFSDVKKKWSGEIKELESQIDEHRQIYQAEKEWREVDCEEVMDWQKGEVRYMRGKECLESRPMDDREQQMAMSVNNRAIDEPSAAVEDAKNKASDDVKDVMNDETSKSTKKSAVDPASGAAEAMAVNP